MGPAAGVKPGRTRTDETAVGVTGSTARVWRASMGGAVDPVAPTDPATYRPEYACMPLKNRFTMVKLNTIAVKPMIASQAEREPRHPRVALAWM